MIPYLVLDRESVSDAEGVTFHLNSATKHPLNPILNPGRPEDWDGLQIAWPGTVLYDAQEGLFKCWYSGLDPSYKPTWGDQPRYWMPGYAESTDGVTWYKPDLGQVDQDGRPTNRFTSDGVSLLGSVYEDREPSSPSRRFVGIWIELLSEPVGKVVWQKRLAFSPDGRVWDWNGPAVYTEGLFDFSQVLQDPDAEDPAARVKVYSQGQLWPAEDGGRPIVPAVYEPHEFIRTIGVFQGESIENVRPAPDPLALAPELGIDDELHFAGVQRVGKQYVMLFESNRLQSDPLDGDFRLAVSDDGLQFRRVHSRDTVVDTGPRGTWDENMIVTTTAGMLEVGDEVRIYYFGCSSVFRAWPAAFAHTSQLRGSLYYPVHMGLATLPLDRWGYASGPGTVTTRPLNVGDDGVWLNCDGEGSAVSLIGADDEVIAEGVVGSTRSRTYYRAVEWVGGAPDPGTYRVRVRLPADGKLYSVGAQG